MFFSNRKIQWSCDRGNWHVTATCHIQLDWWNVWYFAFRFQYFYILFEYSIVDIEKLDPHRTTSLWNAMKSCHKLPCIENLISLKTVEMITDVHICATLILVYTGSKLIHELLKSLVQVDILMGLGQMTYLNFTEARSVQSKDEEVVNAFKVLKLFNSHFGWFWSSRFSYLKLVLLINSEKYQRTFIIPNAAVS